MSDSGLSLASSSASGPVSGERDAAEAVEETGSRECPEDEEEGESDNISDNIRSPAKRRAQARLTHGHGFLSKSVANLSSSK